MSSYDYKDPTDPRKDEYIHPYEKEIKRDKWYSFQKSKVDLRQDLSQGNVVRDYTIQEEEVIHNDKISEKEGCTEQDELSELAKNIDELIKKQEQIKKQAIQLAAHEEKSHSSVQRTMEQENAKKGEIQQKVETIAKNAQSLQEMVDFMINDALPAEKEQTAREDDGR